MPSIDTKVMSHRLAIHPFAKLVVQRKRKVGEKKRVVIDAEVEKLSSVWFITETKYPLASQSSPNTNDQQQMTHVRRHHRSQCCLPHRFVSVVEHWPSNRRITRLPSIKLHGCLLMIQPNQYGFLECPQNCMHVKPWQLLLQCHFPSASKCWRQIPVTLGRDLRPLDWENLEVLSTTWLSRRRMSTITLTT